MQSCILLHSHAYTIPTSHDMGVGGFITYSFLTVFIAMVFYTLFEKLSFASFGSTLLASLSSALITVPIIFFVQLLLVGAQNRR